VQADRDRDTRAVRTLFSIDDHFPSGQRLAAMCADIAVFQRDMGMVTQDNERLQLEDK
jgi:hypothetical protein